ncbi:MAG: hypothetical protein JKY48_11510 [Flavobacteriales bacterium]|nr:hypothetical protein [Flavobacteriales bacterium]
MTWEDFEANIRDVLEIEEDIELKRDEVLENTEFWSSMHALLVMAMAESEYDVSITGEDLRKSSTLGNIYELLNSKVA